MEGFGVSEQAWRKGPWTPEEDKLLVEYVSHYGDGRWSCVSKCAGLNRSGKSCRLRWVNYLRPGLKKGHITPEEEEIIIELHALLGNKWSSIARYLPGRTDNEIKNYWRTHFKKRSSCEQKSKIQSHKQQLEEKDNKYECSNLEASSRREEEREGKRETVSECRSMGSDLHQLMNYSRGCWSDYFVPLDDYLFGVDDQNGCSKMAIQNQDNNIASYSRGGGDAVNYM